MRRIKATSVTGLQIATASTQKLGFWGATPIVRPTGFTVTNWTSDVALDCNAAADAEICDVLGTLILQLQNLGLVGGTVSA